METLTCFGSFCLSLWLCALVSFWRDLTKNKASREGRGRSRRALLLLPPLLLFSSFSFGSSSVSGYSYNSGCRSPSVVLDSVSQLVEGLQKVPGRTPLELGVNELPISPTGVPEGTEQKTEQEATF